MLDSATSTSNRAGEFIITDAVNTQLFDNPAPARDYVTHTSAGTYNGTLNGPVQWEVQVVFDQPHGPLPDPVPCWLYGAGNAADAAAGSSGDYI